MKTAPAPVASPFPLEQLHQALGAPAWFWPVCTMLLFVVLPLAVSAVEWWQP